MKQQEEDPLEGAVGSCLKCYGPIHYFSGIAARCEFCGFINTKDDQREFWTLEPWLADLERVTKLLLAPVLCVLMLVFVAGLGPGVHSGWLFIFPLAAVVAIWKTASLITRRRVWPSPRNVWMTVSFILGVDGVVFGYTFSEPTMIRLGWTSFSMLVLVPFIAVGCLRFRAWRTRSGARFAVANHRLSRKYRFHQALPAARCAVDMEVAGEELRRTRSRLYAVPTPSKPYEALAVLGAILCLIAHLLAIGELNDLASAGGIRWGEMSGVFRTAVWLSLAAFAISGLSLVRIWWEGRRHQGMVLACYGLIINPYMLYMIGWAVHSDGVSMDLPQSVSLVTGLCFAAFLVCVFMLLTRRVGPHLGPRLALGLIALLAVGFGGGAWGALTLRSVEEDVQVRRYELILPESTTSLSCMKVLGEWVLWFPVLALDAEGGPTYRSLGRYCTPVDFDDGQPFDDGGLEREGSGSAFEDARVWLDDLDEWILGRGISREQLWLDSSLHLALAPERTAGEFLELLESCREEFPERGIVSLLVWKRPDANWQRVLLEGEKLNLLHAIQIELEPLAGAFALRAISGPDGPRLLGDEQQVFDAAALAEFLIEYRRPEVNLELARDLTITDTVRILDILREAGMRRIAVIER